ncbi:MAG TPA: tRNA (adenosine(37)-N6)-threonylcarbamoyltransferase complex transferase subunit TsaD [Candidatus Magasanikbacteria bacterium]|nr:tRNA (adenosine(37)-N6)-threonylcarbamoyltransferase complex transferase subunit TsaD [Candidatus Magasanikbacteria bacterium]
MNILGIETSCDETAAALLEVHGGRMHVLKNIVSSQISIHKKYGGVVPEVAARQHAENIIPIIKKTLRKIKPDVIAVTSGPGLATALLVGVEVARTLSYAWNIPLVRTNHIEGHLYANWLTAPSINAIKLPALVLIISGGHTELVLMKQHGVYQLLGKTLDDAAGECFDKVGKMMGLEYPAGPQIGALARSGARNAISLPRPMLEHKNYSFSFAGLKTAVLYHLQKHPLKTRRERANLCASFEQAATDVLVGKTVHAAKEYKVRTVIMGGGVSANTYIRESMETALSREMPKTKFIKPALKYCTDNAAMIAAAGYFHAIKKDFTAWDKLVIDPTWELAQ